MFVTSLQEFDSRLNCLPYWSGLYKACPVPFFLQFVKYFKDFIAICSVLKYYGFMVLGERLQTLRKNSNLSQAELGQTLGLSSTAISLYESGLRSPDYQTLVKICNIFNVSSDYLLGIIDTQTPSFTNGRIVVNCETFTEEQMETLNFLVKSFNAINKKFSDHEKQ